MKDIPSVKELREQAKTTRRGYVYKLIDFLAYYPAKLLLYTPLSPNQITILWVLGQILASLFLIKGEYISSILAILAFHFFFIIDCSDGIVARYKKQYSINGDYLDQIGHNISNPFFIICFSIGIYNQSNELIYLGLGIILAFLYLLNKAATLNPLWFGNPNHRKLVEVAYSRSLIKNQNDLIYTIFCLIRFEYLFNLIFWGTLFGYPEYTLILYVVLYFVEFVRKIFSQLSLNYKLEKQDLEN